MKTFTTTNESVYNVLSSVYIQFCQVNIIYFIGSSVCHKTANTYIPKNSAYKDRARFLGFVK